jgi:hypothetical protein
MPFDALPEKPDLSVPSVRGLAWLLRRQDQWPVRFDWNFAACSACAMRLAWEQWAGDRPQGYFSVGHFTRDTFGNDLMCNAFILGAYEPVPDRDVTPEMVADRLDELAR